MVTTQNPYDAPVDVAEDEELAPPTDVELFGLKQVSFTNALLRWLGICGVCAAPSFLFGWSMSQHALAVPSMIVGVLIFAVGYALLDIRPMWRRWMSQKVIRNSILWAYGLRMASGLYPVNDVVMGMISTGFVNLLFGAGNGGDHGLQLKHPASIFLTTITQGILLNLEIFIGVLVLIGIGRGWQTIRKIRGQAPTASATSG